MIINSNTSFHNYKLVITLVAHPLCNICYKIGRKILLLENRRVRSPRNFLDIVLFHIFVVKLSGALDRSSKLKLVVKTSSKN